MVNIRIGNGYDIHQLSTNRRLILGGVEIPHELGLLGHSDADVLTHAIMDAMLGALSLGDIGLYFPPSDSQWAGADSLVLLSKVNQLISDRGWKIGNIDSVVVAERPKLKPHISSMRDRTCKFIFNYGEIVRFSLKIFIASSVYLSKKRLKSCQLTVAD